MSSLHDEKKYKRYRKPVLVELGKGPEARAKVHEWAKRNNIAQDELNRLLEEPQIEHTDQEDQSQD